MDLRQCQVCQEAQYKYKCPSCFLPYCSLACFKRHKENPCNMLTSLEDTASMHPSSQYGIKFSMVLPERSFEVDETSWILGRDRLLLIAESEGICDALKDVELQKLVYKIDSSKNPEEELDKAIGRDGFLQFTEMILSTVSSNEKTI